MYLRFCAIKLLLCLSIMTGLSLSAAELSLKKASPEEIRDGVMSAVCNQGYYAPELLWPRLSFYLGLLCNRNDKFGKVIAENAVCGILALSPDGRYCAFILQSDCNSIQVYDTHMGKVLPALSCDTNRVRCVAFSPDGTLLFAGDENGDVYVWNLESGKLIRKYTCPPSEDSTPQYRPVHCFSADCRSCSIDCYPDSKCWNFDEGTIIRARDLGYGSAVIGSFSASGQLLLGYGSKWDWCVYDIVNKREILSFNGGSVSYAGASNLIAVCHYDFSHVKILDTRTGNLLKTLPLNNRRKACLLWFGPDGNYLVVSVGLRRRLYVFDVKAGLLVQEFNIGPVDIKKRSIAVDRYGQVAAFGRDDYGNDSKVRLFNSLPQSVREALHSLSLNQLLVLMEIVPALARGHIIHLTPNGAAWNLVNQMPREIRALVEPCLQPLSWTEYLRSWVSWR